MTTLQRVRELCSLLRGDLDRFVVVRLSGVALLVVAGAAITGLTPLAFKVLIDTLDGVPSSGAGAGPVILAYVASQWLGRIISDSRAFFHGRVERRLIRALSHRLFEHIFQLPLRYHLQRRTGAVSQTLAEGLLGFQLTLQHCLFTFIPLLVEVATMTFVLARLGRSEFLAVIGCVFLCYLLVQARAIARTVGPAHAASGAWIDANGVLTDSILNYETIKYFGAESAMRERYAASLARSESEWLRLFRTRAWSGFAGATVLAIGVAVAGVLAAREVRAGTMTIAEFVLVNTYLLQALHPLEVVGYAMRDMAQASASLARLLDLLREPHEHIGAGTALVRPCGGTLTFEHVTMGYRCDRPVLRDVSFSVQAGQKLGVVGASGAGKSSLVRLLARLAEPDRGRILLDGTPIDQLDVVSLRAAIAVVPQDVALFNDTLRHNITIAKPGCTPQSMARAVQVAGLERFIAGLPEGYETVVGERGVRLSGGERQRIAIARAVLRDARVLVLDEATSSLDSRTEHEIQQRLDALVRSVTTLTIAHRLSTVRHADHIIVLEDGEIVETGTHAQLLHRDGHYAQLWHAQEGGRSHAFSSRVPSPALANIETDVPP